MRQPHERMDRRPTGDTVPAPFERAVTAAITGLRTVGSVRALTFRKFLVSSLRSATSASTLLSCVATAAAFGHS